MDVNKMTQITETGSSIAPSPESILGLQSDNVITSDLMDARACISEFNESSRLIVGLSSENDPYSELGDADDMDVLDTVADYPNVPDLVRSEYDGWLG